MPDARLIFAAAAILRYFRRCLLTPPLSLFCDAAAARAAVFSCWFYAAARLP